MIQKETVRRRLLRMNRWGITSYTEFSYMILQALRIMVLNERISARYKSAAPISGAILRAELTSSGAEG